MDVALETADEVVTLIRLSGISLPCAPYSSTLLQGFHSQLVEV